MYRYKLIEASSIELLERDVNDLIDSGWRPLGGPCGAPFEDTFRRPRIIYVQAMVLDEA